MKFKFSLAPVLKVRQHQETLQKQKLAEEVTRQQQISEVRDDVQGKLKHFLEDANDHTVENIHTIRRRSAHLQQVHQKMNRLSKDLNEVEIQVKEERKKLADAHKNLHILEKVKEFEQSIFSKKIAKDEQKFMDEIATQSFSR